MIRNSLLILDTYKSLIYFPQNVDKYLKNDDYEQIITSYKLANMQLSKAEPATRKSSLFAQIKNDLDSKVCEVQKHILEKLVQFPSSPDDQKFLIDYYNALEALNVSKKDQNQTIISPAWYCLEEEKKWFIQLMIECRDMHIADEKVSLALKQSDTNDSSSSNSSKQQDSKQPGQNESQKSESQINNQTIPAGGILSAAEAAKIQAMTPIPHERNKFIEELCQMFFDIFTDYWRLGSMYLSNFLTLQVNTNSSKKATKMSSNQTPEDFYKLVGEILETFCNIVRAAFIPHTFEQSAALGEKLSTDKNANSKNLLLPWPIQHDAKIISQILPHCLKVCR